MKKSKRWRKYSPILYAIRIISTLQKAPHLVPHPRNCPKQPWMTKNYRNQEKYRQDKEKNGRHGTTQRGLGIMKEAEISWNKPKIKDLWRFDRKRVVWEKKTRNRHNLNGLGIKIDGESRFENGFQRPGKRVANLSLRLSIRSLFQRFPSNANRTAQNL